MDGKLFIDYHRFKSLYTIKDQIICFNTLYKLHLVHSLFIIQID